ncbi:MAG: hypothetical protein IPM69_07640 [Ignavibacteria bacterium]|nr:hypothetical protein [Ignavibacteria bacterium]
MNLGFQNIKDKDRLFWEWFVENQIDYYKDGVDEFLFDRLGYQLNEIDPNLTFEFSPIHDNGIKEFVISAGGLKVSFPSVKRLVEKAPKITNWEIIAFRQRLPLEYDSVKYGDLDLSYDDIYFRYSNESDKIGVELNIMNYSDVTEFNQAIYLLLDGLLGEYDVETKLSWIQRKVLDETQIENLFRFVELRDLVDATK